MTSRNFWGWTVCSAHLIMTTLAVTVMYSFSQILVELNNTSESTIAQLSMFNNLCTIVLF